MKIDTQAWYLPPAVIDPGKPNLVVYSSCHTWSILTYLHDYRHDVYSRYNVYGIVVHLAREANARFDERFLATFASADILIYHNLDIFKYDGYRLEDLFLKLGARTFTMSSPQASCFWPFLHGFAPAEEPVRRLLRQGVEANEICRRFDAGTMQFDFRYRLEQEFERWWARDRNSDLNFTDFLIEHYRDLKIFSTNNHATFPVYAHLCEQLIGELGLDRRTEAAILNLPIEGLAWQENHFPETPHEFEGLELTYPRRYYTRQNFPNLVQDFYHEQVRKIAADFLSEE